MKTPIPAPLEAEIRPSKNEEPSPSSSSSSFPSGEAASTPLREAPDNPQPSTNNPQPAPNSQPTPPRANGRPTRLTPHLIAAICHQITEFGNSDTAAAAHFGIPASTLSRWKFLNPDMELRFASSREDFRSRHVYKIENATTKDGRHDWRASAWLLERIFPQDYARRPGRRVNPASEEQTWLEESAAKHAEKQERDYRWEFKSALELGPDVARDYLTHPVWDLIEPNANAPLPVTASFDAKHKGPASLPSYATYAEALEQALHFDARKSTIDFPLPTPAPASASSQGETSSSSSSSSSPSRHPRASDHINGHAAVAPACSYPEGRDAAPPASQTSRRGQAAGGAEQNASPESAPPLDTGASRNDGVSPSHHPNGEAAVFPQQTSKITETPADEVTPITSEITETPPPVTPPTHPNPATPAAQPPPIPVFPVLAEFPFATFSKSPTSIPFQNFQNSSEPALAS